MTVLRLVALRHPREFADWYRFGADYVRDVAAGMDLDLGEFPDLSAGATAALRSGDDLSDPQARSVAADLLADAAYLDPFSEWMPLWYELGLALGNAYAAFSLRRTARTVIGDLDVSAPRFSRPTDVLVAGAPATRSPRVRGFARRFVFANAVLHLEWFVHVARESGVDVPPALVARARAETVAHYGRGAPLSPEIREFQRLLFADDAWVRRIDEAYGLDSALFSVWERLLTRERERLGRGG